MHVTAQGLYPQELDHAQLRDTVGAADFKRKQAAGTDQFPDRVAVQTKHLRSLLKADGIGVAGKHLGIGIVKLHRPSLDMADDHAVKTDNLKKLR